ncbi:hypothetical protein DFP92_1119 [Yoonia sediminilitoris]|uniref:Uncharacterized protein n=1 Tax=Yoonia sediminilitoris TaxID=1286148 RepID=A0A2T6KB34_9RHOB|nr:hypothetical protein C8N45_11110 [Yoonia sediminilitoris]RCW92860.1 hypothetical protein DFP92_1119 [Yoonia sediminilitoris]
MRAESFIRLDQDMALRGPWFFRIPAVRFVRPVFTSLPKVSFQRPVTLTQGAASCNRLPAPFATLPCCRFPAIAVHTASDALTCGAGHLETKKP